VFTEAFTFIKGKERNITGWRLDQLFAYYTPLGIGYGFRQMISPCLNWLKIIHVHCSYIYG
jgi:hypothetical protein